MYKYLSRFYFHNLLLVTLYREICSEQTLRDPRILRRSSVPPEGVSHFPIGCNPLLANAEEQVELTTNQVDTNVNDHGQVLDLNQTLTATVAWQPENTVCYDDLGCITRFSFADPLLWPINLLPEAREKIDTHFTLHTRENPNPQPPIRISADDPTAISATTFKPTRPTKFFIHGWRDSGYEENYQELLQSLLQKGDFNVICVHWGGGSSAFYFQAHANTRLVGLEIALLVNTTVEKLGVKIADVHLIGHSLGAHTAGYAGEQILNLGQITGLDPAGPYFRRMPSFARLDYTDALFVDGVHTDADFLGIYEPVGHLDFYPNGGKSQPGCLPSKWSDFCDPFAVLSDVTACDHMRAVHYYSSSLKDVCQTIGYECVDYDSYNSGKCTSCGSDNTKCAPFGLDAIKYPSRARINVKLYSNTGEVNPYCSFQYIISVQLAKPRVAKPTVYGLLRLSVRGETDYRPNFSLPIAVLEHGKDHRFLLNSPSELGPIKKVFLHWQYIHSDLLDPSCFLGICNKKLYVNSITVSPFNSYPEANKIPATYVNCPRYPPAAIPTFQSMEFSVENSCTSTFQLLNVIWNTAPWILL
ncbi:pancreatic lipase-related protein 2-like [Daphnia carinata]|uniref:pancreatic lipase-related protein 2-like n=1 Tax=Daphnia carinata TaxID=120202 RepID=UPI00257E240C|nr:pancreatic lipase-related protein 2-like [Daphnia carinata]